MCRGVADKGDRSVIDKVDLHVGLKHSCSHFERRRGTGTFNKIFVESFGLFGAGGLIEARTASAAGVGVESELGNDEEFTGDVENAVIHFAIGVLKNAQVDDLLKQPVGVGLRISLAHPEQHQQAFANSTGDLMVDFDAGFFHSLQHGAHTVGEDNMRVLKLTPLRPAFEHSVRPAELKAKQLQLAPGVPLTSA